MHRLFYHPRAIKFLKKLSKKEAKSVLERLEILQQDSFSSQLDIKKLETTKKSYRLRIGNLRVIFEADSKKKIIYVHEIGFKGSIY